MHGSAEGASIPAVCEVATWVEIEDKHKAFVPIIPTLLELFLLHKQGAEKHLHIFHLLIIVATQKSNIKI